jgi:hypothetical protein
VTARLCRILQLEKCRVPVPGFDGFVIRKMACRNIGYPAFVAVYASFVRACKIVAVSTTIAAPSKIAFGIRRATSRPSCPCLVRSKFW